eukprot:scaffold310584_cov28-Tisochrysis_lutea.AAC.2
MRCTHGVSAARGFGRHAGKHFKLDMTSFTPAAFQLEPYNCLPNPKISAFRLAALIPVARGADRSSSIGEIKPSNTATPSSSTFSRIQTTTGAPALTMREATLSGPNGMQRKMTPGRFSVGSWVKVSHKPCADR